LLELYADGSYRLTFIKDDKLIWTDFDSWTSTTEPDMSITLRNVTSMTDGQTKGIWIARPVRFGRSIAVCLSDPDVYANCIVRKKKL
jgi:hypothetical protein